VRGTATVGGPGADDGARALITAGAPTSPRAARTPIPVSAPSVPCDRRGPLAIVDPNPTYRRGLATILRDAGHHPVEQPDLTSWLTGSANRAVAFTVQGVAPLDELAGVLHLRPDAIVIALLPHLEGDAVAGALRAGAAAVAGRDDQPDRLVAVIEHAFAGDALLPAELARHLAHNPPVDALEELGLTPDELGWLRGLADNCSIARIAAEAHVSERTMYRRLDQLFRRIGVNNRAEAIAWATRRALLGS
jgi:DNA-binding NarL/FixJ family response regulator